MTPTNCQICGWREYVDHTDWDDGRRVRACGVCLEPPDVPPEWEYEPTQDTQAPCFEYAKPTRAGIAAFIAQAGEASARDVLVWYGVDPNQRGKGYSTVTMFLSRMKRDGELVARKSGGAGGHQSAFIYSSGTPKVRKHLPQHPRAEVVALFRKGKDAPQIARKLGMNIPAVRTAICAARRAGELEAA